MTKQINVLDQLASSLNRRDEVPNQELAKEMVLSEDKEAIKVLVTNLTNKKAIQNDCIKVLYEIGEQKPKLIAGYVNEFVAQLGSKNNRLQWGAMIAIGTIVKERPKEIYESLTKILDAADKGSVITKDHAVNILIKLCQVVSYSKDAFPLLLEQLLKSAPNQFPMYAERAMPIINDDNKSMFVRVLNSRLDDLEKESKKKRVQKLIARLTKD